MNGKKIFIFLLVILSLILILPVSAQEVDNDNGYEVLAGESNEVASFRDLYFDVRYADTTLYLEKDYCFNSTTDSVLSSGIAINNSLTIEGNGHYIDAAGSSRIFIIQNMSVTFNNVTFKNAYSNAGGVVYSREANVTFSNSNFVNSRASDYGGVIYMINTTLIVNNSHVNGSYSNQGGMIYSYTSDTSISNSIFESCVSFDGSAIYSYKNSLNITNSSFINDYALSKGVIYSFYTSVNISESDFTKCSADFGVIYIYKNNLEVNNSNFTNLNSNYGGAIYLENSSADVYNSNFRDSQTISAGAIYLYNSDLKVYDSNFTNLSSQFGGAIYGVFSTSYINRSYFYCNTANYGGAIFNINSTSRIDKSSFIDNQAFNSGGAIYQMYHNLHLTGSEFMYNHAGDGGAICIDLYSSFTSSNSNFTNNTAEKYGGALCLMFNSEFDNSTNLFENNDICFVDDMDFTFGGDDYKMYYYKPEIPSAIPSYYNSVDEGYITQVKNQGDEGNCWAFAALAALESAILKATGETYDFSEENMKNLMGYFSDYGWNRDTNGEGSYSMALTYLTSWMGPIYEEEDPYVLSNLFSQVFDNIMRVYDVLFIGRKNASDIADIKHAIMQYGAVATSMRYFKNYLSNTTNGYYYYGNSTEINHAVTIVGWNDTYSKDNFLQTPPGDGAFIVKNSWGEDWGDNGYFYVSYYDTVFAYPYESVNYAFIFNNTFGYDKIYQHYIGRTRYIFYPDENVIWGKNIFQASEDGFIAAVATYFESDTDWEMDIYIGNELKHSQNGSSKAGYYTLQLDKFVEIKENDTFSIVIKYTGEGKLPVASDENISRDFFKANVSFLSLDGQHWSDVYQWGYNIIIKALTFYSLEPEIRVSHLSEVEIENPVNIQAKVYDSFNNLITEGQVIFVIDNETYIVNITNGIASLNVTFNTSGIHNICSIFNSSDYSNFNTTTNVSVYKHASNLNIDVNDTYYGENTLLNVNTNIASGTLTVILNNVSETVDIIDNVASYSFSNLNAGNYTLTVNYKGNNYYNESSAIVLFKVKKTSSSIIISPIANVTYGESVSVSVDLINGSGGSYILSDGRTGDLSNLTFGGLDAGNYTITVINNGDTNHASSNASSVFTVNRALSNIYIDDLTDISYNSSLNVAFRVNDYATGSVNVSVYNGADLIASEVVAVNKDAVFNNLSVGDYRVIVSYLGDNNYFGSDNSTAVSVIKASSGVIISPIANVTYGESVSVSVDLINGSGGSYILSDGRTGDLSNLTFDGLDAGNYTITVINNGDANHASSNASSVFTVNKASSSLIIGDITNVTYREDVIVTVNLVNGTEGSYILSDGRTGDLSNLTFDGLDAGNYTITVINNGDANHASSNASSVFTVNRDLSSVYVDELGDIIYNSSLTVDFRVNDYATGNVNVSVYNGADLIASEVVGVNEKTVFNNLSAGDYRVIVSYLGDNNYFGSDNSTTVSVIKASSSVSISPIANVTYGENVTVSVDLTNGTVGSYNLSRNNVLVESGDLNNLTFMNLDAGNYTITLINDGDANHNASNISTVFTVYKANITLTMSISDIKYGEDAVINIAISYGNNLSLTVESPVYSNISQIEINKNKSIAISNLNASDYNVSVKFNGDNNHNPLQIVKSFNVTKINATLLVSVKNATYGDNASITVNITSGDISDLSVKLADYTFNQNSSKIFTQNISSLNAGQYDILINYSGNNNYLENIIKTSLSIFKAQSVINVSYDNITFGDIFKINLTSNTDGVINNNIAVNAFESILLNYTDLSAGNYSIPFNLMPNNVNYDNCTVLVNFTVYKLKSILNIKTSNFTYPDNVSVNLTSNVCGVVQLTVGNITQNITLTANETRKIDFGILDANNYTVTAIMGENANYTSCLSEASFEVRKAIPEITLEVNNTYYSNDLTVKMIADTTGSANIKLNNRSVKNISLTAYNMSFINLGILNSGNYTISVIFDCGDNYITASIQKNFSILAVESYVSLTADSITYGENAIITILSNVNTTAILNVGINSYLVNVSSFGLTKEISNLNASIYNVTITFEDRINYKGYSNTTSLTVMPAKSSVTIENISDFTTDKKVIINFNIVNKTVAEYVLKKDGVEIKKSDAVSPIDLGILDKGFYTIIVSNQATNNYLASSDNKSFSINTVNATISVDKTEVSKGENIKIRLNDNATGNVVLKIDSRSYNLTLSNSQAVFNTSNLSNGSYDMYISYSGDNKYSSGSKLFKIIVKTSYIIKLENLTKFYKGPERLNISLSDDRGVAVANVNVSITINGNPYTRTTDNNGKISMAINLNSGNYTVAGEYGGVIAHSTIVVESTVNSDNISKIYKNATQYYATFKDSNGNLLTGSEVTFNINGMLYKRTTNADGVASMNINLNPGEYILTAENPSNGELHSNTIKVLSSLVEANDLTKYYRNASKYSLKVLGGDGNPLANVNVSFNINGVFYTRTSNASGYVNMNINLNPGTYIITAEYNALKVSNTIKILPILSAGDLKMSYRDGSKFTVKLVNGTGSEFAGQQITFNINGVFYQRTTNSSGIAGLNINLMPGEYIITSQYGTAMTSNKITVRG